MNNQYDVYSPPKETSTVIQHVYSPIQAAMGCFLGGPLASIVLIRHNFKVLGNIDAEKKTTFYGAIIFLLFLLVVALLPEKFSNIVIPLITMFATGYFINKNQFTKQAIEESPLLTFQSNWRVFWIGVVCFVLTIVAFVVLVVIFGSLGINLLPNQQ